MLSVMLVFKLNYFRNKMILYTRYLHYQFVFASKHHAQELELQFYRRYFRVNIRPVRLSIIQSLVSTYESDFTTHSALEELFSHPSIVQ